MMGDVSDEEQRAAAREKRREKKAQLQGELAAKERRESSAPLRVEMYFQCGTRSVPLRDVEEVRRDLEGDHELELPDEPPPGWAEP